MENRNPSDHKEITKLPFAREEDIQSDVWTEVRAVFPSADIKSMTVNRKSIRYPQRVIRSTLGFGNS